MKIECIKEQLQESLSKADKISSKNPNLPALAGIYLKAEKNELSLRSTNLDIGLNLSIPVKVVEPGEVLVPAHTFTSFISSLNKDRTVAITLKDQVLEVKTPSTKTSFKTLAIEDFPVIPEINENHNLIISSKEFNLGIRSVIYAAAVGSIKPELSSILIKNDGDYLTFVATDSFRLSEKRIKIKNTPGFKQILIPQKNALEIIKIFDKNDEELNISVDEHQLAIRSQNVYLTSRIIDGNFPDYKQIIPKEAVSKVIVLKQDLINAIKTSSIFTDSFNQLKIKVDPKNKKIELETKNNTVGEAVQSLDAVIEGTELTINLNQRYLSECFQSINTDSVSLEFSGEAKPALVKGVGDNSYLYLVMPMNRS